MNDAQSDTPRVDAVLADWPMSADFEERERDLETLARSLERELSAAKSERVAASERCLEICNLYRALTNKR